MTQESQVALVIGGSRGIGAAAARELAAAGWRVAVMARTAGDVLRVAEEIGGLAIVGSLTERADLERAIRETQEAFGGLHALVNSSGHAVKKPLLEITDEEWQEGFELYLLNAIRTVRLVTPIFEAQGRGSIVNVSTSSPFEPTTRFPVSTTVRAALASFTKIYADEYGPSGIRINNVLPGFMTEGWADVPPEWTQRIPLRRAAHPDEVARVIRFLVSEEASYMTGQNVRVDGGVARSV